jgi:hypothetical protein
LRWTTPRWTPDALLPFEQPATPPTTVAAATAIDNSRFKMFT